MSDVTSQVASNVATYPQSPVVLRDVPVSLAERRTKKSA